MGKYGRRYSGKTEDAGISWKTSAMGNLKWVQLAQLALLNLTQM